METTGRHKWVRGVGAASLPLLALAIQLPLWGLLAPFTWVLLLPTVFISAWIGGLWAGLASTALAAIIGTYFFVPPYHTFILSDVKALFAVAVFVAAGVLFSVLLEGARRRQEALQAEREGAAEEVRRLNAELAAAFDIRTAQLLTALASTTDAVYISDREGRLLERNEAFARFHRFHDLAEAPKAVAQFQDFFEIRLADGTIATARDWPSHRALRGETGENVDYRLRRRDTGESWIGAYSFAPIRTNEGTIAGAVIVARDVTEMREAAARLRDSEQLYRTVTSSTPDHLLVQDADLRYTLVVNPQLGLTEAEMLGRTDSELGNEEDSTRITAIKRQVMKTGVPYTLETALANARGGTEHFDGIYVPKRDDKGRVDGVIGYFRNVTARKLAEDSLIERTRELEDALRARSEFVAGMSHELRTPLNAVIGFAGILESGAPGELNDEQARQVGMIHVAGVQLLALVNEVLDISRLDEVGVVLDVADVELDEVLALVDGFVRPLAELKGIAFQISAGDAPPTLHTDAARLVRILQNLAGNAVKFTNQGAVSVSATTDAQAVVFVVSDTGIGIAASELPKIFERFHQGSVAGIAKTEGSGLGLAVAREYAEALGGTLIADSDGRTGSIFTLRLPATSLSTPVQDSDAVAAR